jgi:hypothetical protein
MMTKMLTRSPDIYRLPEEVIGARVWGFLYFESQGHYWVCAQLQNGRFRQRGTDLLQGGNWSPGEEKKSYARRVCAAMNKHCRHGGLWFVCWIHDGMQFFLLWKDADGDIHIPIECDKPWIVIREWPMAVWERHGEEAWEAWREVWKAVEPDPAGQALVAQGEALPSGQASEVFFGTAETPVERPVPSEHLDDTVQKSRVVSLPRDADAK